MPQSIVAAGGYGGFEQASRPLGGSAVVFCRTDFSGGDRRAAFIMKNRQSASWREVLAGIADKADAVDSHSLWPQSSLRRLKQAGAMRWAVERRFGGTGMAAMALHRRYEQVAACCLTTALAWTQRDAAVGLLQSCPATSAIGTVLQTLAQGRSWATIGISQLTTSTQHQHQPAVVAARTAAGWTLDGRIPWVTGANESRWIVVGTKTTNRQELLVLLPTSHKGVTPGRPPPMAALNGSKTCAVRLKGVEVRPSLVLLGPCAHVLAARDAVRRFSLTTCVLPLGVAAGAISASRLVLSGRSAQCRRSVATLRNEYKHLARCVYRRGSGGKLPSSEAAALRAKANLLAFRSSLMCLELSKGRGFVMGNAAQRRVREAMFCCVWSSNAHVIEETVRQLALAAPDAVP